MGGANSVFGIQQASNPWRFLSKRHDESFSPIALPADLEEQESAIAREKYFARLPDTDSLFDPL
jgi:hypothetical protein